MSDIRTGRLEGEATLVTGAGSGIGRAVAHRFAVVVGGLTSGIWGG